MDARAHGGDPPDAELITRCLEGDETAFELLFQRYRDALYGYALRMLRNATEAEEAAIEIIEKVFANLPTFRIDQEFRPWLYGIARNECLMRLRRSRKLQQLEMAARAWGPASAAPDAPELSEEAAMIRTQVDGLEEPYRETVILAYFQGLNSREIAGILSTNENTVRTRLARALKLLRERMDEHA
jgi:RNA polymerase sigma-70 factor (ECF subfamily)